LCRKEEYKKKAPVWGLFCFKELLLPMRLRVLPFREKLLKGGAGDAF
jgi:hypothetical protein